jgi:TRAP-type C4-dicarboxylate transport system permease small subunit
MQLFMMRLAHYTNLLGQAGLWLAGLGVVFMTVIIFLQVFVRYVLNSSLPWTEPGAVMVMGWFIFLGAAVGVREGYHLAFDVVLYFIPEKLKLIFFSISDLVVLAFSGGMVWYGVQLAVKTAGNKLPSLGISGAFDYLPLVVGGVLIAIFSVERLARRAAGLPTARFGEDGDPNGGPVTSPAMEA